ncbi:MAG: hypothetical protein NC086_02955 [Alistipes sp.]|nr:hypothetical protein [Alistipes sp.]
MEILDDLFWKAKLRFLCFVNDFKKDEMGVSSIVATILLILVVVLLVAMFWKYISQWLTDMWEKITNKAETIGG